MLNDDEARAFSELQGNPIWEHAMWLLAEAAHPITLTPTELDEKIRKFVHDYSVS
jgi:hypothetical protein